MPNWKKVIISGSNAQLNSLYVTGGVTASGYFGTASWAVSASWAPGGQSVTASYALTASYFDGQSHAVHTQTTASVTWTVTHNLNNETPGVTVWDSTKKVVIPQEIASVNANSLTITFPVSQSGYALISNGTILQNASTVVTASYAISASYAPGALVDGATYNITASWAISASWAPGGQSVTSSYALTASFTTSTFSRGGTISDVTFGVSTTGSYPVWRAAFPCRVTALYGYSQNGGAGTTQVNAWKSGSSGYSLHTASNLVIGTTLKWFSANSVQNTDYATGDTLILIVSGSGEKSIAVQVDFIRI